MNIRTSTKTTTKHNILPFPSFITNKTQHNRNGNQAHTHKQTQTYSLRRRMAPIPVKTGQEQGEK